MGSALTGPIVQIAYFVGDIRARAQEMASIFGAGPFFVAERIELAWAEPHSFVHSSAYGQWGDVMLELVQQDEEGPSPFRDSFAPGEEGIHHVATMVESLERAYEHYAHNGFDTAARAATSNGVELAFIDTRDELGCMVELYERSKVAEFYSFVHDAAQQWDGTDPVRELGGPKP